MTIFVSRSFKVIYLQVLANFVLIDTEVEVRIGCNFSVCLSFEGGKLFCLKLILETKSLNFMLDERCNSVFDSRDFTVISALYIGKFSEEFLPGINIIEQIMVILGFNSTLSVFGSKYLIVARVVNTA